MPKLSKISISSSVQTKHINKPKKSQSMCAPNVADPEYSCISLEVLVEMARAYNRHITEEKKKTNDKSTKDLIVLNDNDEMMNRNKYKRYLVDQFKQKLANICKDDYCWSQQAFIKQMRNKQKEELKRFTFKPKGPQGKWEWLNTININQTMLQYMAKYDDFTFIGAVPIDFQEIGMGIDDNMLNELYNLGKYKLGVVFNLDDSKHSGSHWVSCYANMKNGNIYFFDSCASFPVDEIREYIKTIGKFCKSKGINTNAQYNKTRHQYGDTECGVYSMNFIISMLENENFFEKCTNPIDDDSMNLYRKVYFI